MPYLSCNDLENIAAQVTNDYEKLPRFASAPVRKIDPEILCRDLCGLTLDHYHLSQSRTTLGLTSYNEFGIGVKDENEQPLIYYLDGNTILVESSLKDNPAQLGRYHFTVMHETAHHILNRMFPKGRNTLMPRVMYYRSSGNSGPGRDWDEWQADTLASALLLPIDIVWSALCAFGLDSGIQILNRVFAPREYERFSQMADFLGVSKQALAVRLKRLGVLKRDYLENPYELVDIWKEADPA